MRLKKAQTVFWLSLHYVPNFSLFVTTFNWILQLLWLVPRALALVPWKVSEKHKKDVFATFAWKSHVFHWKQVQKRTLSCNREQLAWPKNSPWKNTQWKIFFIPNSKKLILSEWGAVPTPSFFSTPRPVREKWFKASATSALVLSFRQIPFFNDVCSRNGIRESGTLVSAQSHFHQFQLPYIRANHWRQLEKTVKHQ